VNLLKVFQFSYYAGLHNHIMLVLHSLGSGALLNAFAIAALPLSGIGLDYLPLLALEYAFLVIYNHHFNRKKNMQRQ
jgi:hypothetical protein